jgi:hypothetical protein
MLSRDRKGAEFEGYFVTFSCYGARLHYQIWPIGATSYNAKLDSEQRQRGRRGRLLPSHFLFRIGAYTGYM